MDEKQEIKESPQSVEMSYNAKGLLSGKVKVYADKVDDAYDKAVELSDKLLTRIKDKNGI